ncbi:MAG: DUF1540 domain-containing protein [Eubacteriales bacterium]|nr:DUF1540 domain-containing protein [Eubacteriales bacterium]
MTELKCDAVSCTYNNDDCCCRGDILVGGSRACSIGDTCCESFREQREGSARNRAEQPSPRISIDCEAVRCLYNTNYKCQAEHVDILGGRAGESRETACGTFVEK